MQHARRRRNIRRGLSKKPMSVSGRQIKARKSCQLMNLYYNLSAVLPASCLWCSSEQSTSAIHAPDWWTAVDSQNANTSLIQFLLRLSKHLRPNEMQRDTYVHATSMSHSVPNTRRYQVLLRSA